MTETRMNKFRVALTRDFLAPSGDIAMGDIGLERLRGARGVSVEFFAEHLPEASAEQVSGYDAILSLSPQYTTRSFAGSNSGLSVLARMGVGYDMVDVDALTNHNVILTITPDGVRRPMATAVVTLLLALSHQLLAKDRLIREGRWEQRTSLKTTGLTGKTFGSVGVGNIGREALRLLKPFDMVCLATDPYVKADEIADLGVPLVDLETLMRRSDFVSLHCPLTPETRGLIGERELSWMKPTAYFINASRGPVVDQAALYRALKERRIRGAALDVFHQEPVPADEPLLRLDNVILTPHSLCWSDECFLRMGQSAIDSILSVLKGEAPAYVVNREVLQKPAMRAKLEANRARWRAISEEEL
ncbi:MAG TPA: NAD(P)-dependent oxidoreductase [Terriglobia bacterium]|nr:NAD(P)-dependent oxidoreductase [Terriglobia bacterium]